MSEHDEQAMRDATAAGVYPPGGGKWRSKVSRGGSVLGGPESSPGECHTRPPYSEDDAVADALEARAQAAVADPETDS